MTELINTRPEKEEKSKAVSEEDYINAAVQSALRSGWVAEDQIEILKEKYLKPIYAMYAQLVEECRILAEGEEEYAEEDIKAAIRRLNYCLEATHRIGSTDAQNILDAVSRYLSESKTNLEYSAVEDFLKFISNILII